MTMRMVAPARTGEPGMPAHGGPAPVAGGVDETVRRLAPGNESRRQRRPTRVRTAPATVRVTFGF